MFSWRYLDPKTANSSGSLQARDQAPRPHLPKILLDKLDVSKLSRVLQAKYGGIDAAEVLGEVGEITETFINIQERL